MVSPLQAPISHPYFVEQAGREGFPRVFWGRSEERGRQRYTNIER